MRRGPAVALLGLGCALAAAAAGTGPYLGTHRVPGLALRIRLPRARRVPLRPKPGHGVVERYVSLLSLALEALVVLVVVAGVLYGAWRVAQVLLRLVRLRLAPSGGRAATTAYDDDPLADDAETVLRRRVRDELAALSAGLDEAAEPREAVIACYVGMEHALAEAGVARQHTESPFELLARVLGELDVPEPDVRRLTELFTEARFSAHPVTEDMRGAARRSLDGIAGALAVRA